MGETTVENSIEVSQNIKNRIMIWFSKSTSEYLSKGVKIRLSKRYQHSHICCNIIHNTQTWKQLKKARDIRYTKWNKEIQKDTWCIYIIKTVKFLQVESGIVLARERQGKEGSMSQTAQTFRYKRWVSPRDLLFSMVTTVNILYYMLKIC